MESLLAVLAHPDDESFMIGGALAVHADRGGRAGLLCLTDGQAGRTAGLVDPEILGPYRREELRRAAAVLGIGELYTPGLMDGGLAGLSDEEGSALVEGYAGRFDADVLLTFGPEGASGHSDHKACHRWTLAAAHGRRVFVSVLPPGQEELARGGPTLPATHRIDVSSIGDRKRRAFLEHKTQVYHLELYDRIQSVFDGSEYYHRVRPPSRDGHPLLASLIQD